MEPGFEDLAKYPVLKEAGDYFRMRSIGVEELESEDYRQVLNRARDRVIEAARGSKVSYLAGSPDLEIQSFVVALMLVKATGSELLYQRYSLSEARRIEDLLIGERDGMVEHVAKTLGFDVKRGPDYRFLIHVKDYLKYSVRLRSEVWKLTNRDISKGYVRLVKRELARLVREAVRDVIYERLKDMPRVVLPGALSGMVEELRAIAPRPIRMAKDRRSGALPPCVRHALELLKEGKNVPHIGRFLLASYLISTGSSVEEVVSLFSTAPDFKERVARYQVEHIAGIRGGGKRYSPPSCTNLQRRGFCFKTDECDEIKNPLQFRGERVG